MVKEKDTIVFTRTIEGSFKSGRRNCSPPGVPAVLYYNLTPRDANSARAFSLFFQMKA